MKVLVVVPSFHRGGAERVVSRLTREWAKAHEVKIAVFDSSDQAYEYGGELIDLKLPAVKFQRFGQMRQASRRVVVLARLFCADRPDRIISFMETANFPAILAAVMTGYAGRLWVSVRNDPARFPRAYRRLIPLLYRWPACVVAVSQGVAGALRDMRVPQGKLRAIPNPAPADAPSLGEALARPTRAPARYILGVGRLHPQKGFDRLLSAFALLPDSEMDLVILGEGPERERLNALAERLGLARRVHLLGEEQNVWPWYRHAQCFVLSSRYEGWPNVLLEAMSQGCPVVCFDCHYGASEIIENGRSGALVPEGDIGRLRSAIEDVAYKCTSRRCLIDSGLRRVSELHRCEISNYWLNAETSDTVGQ